jgi:hypothetical protein
MNMHVVSNDLCRPRKCWFDRICKFLFGWSCSGEIKTNKGLLRESLIVLAAELAVPMKLAIERAWIYMWSDCKDNNAFYKHGGLEDWKTGSRTCQE